MDKLQIGDVAGELYIPHMCKHAHTHAHTCTYTHTHNTHTTHTHTHTNTHTHKRTHTNTHTRTYAHTNTHAYAHIYAPLSTSCRSRPKGPGHHSSFPRDIRQPV